MTCMKVSDVRTAQMKIISFVLFCQQPWTLKMRNSIVNLIVNVEICNIKKMCNFFTGRIILLDHNTCVVPIFEHFK